MVPNGSRIRSGAATSAGALAGTDLTGSRDSGPAGFRLPPHVVGRRAEVAELHATLDRFAAASQACVVLVGEAGIGKTRLLDLLCDLAAERGYRTARGSAIEFERGTPYGAVVHALDAVAGDLDSAVLDKLGPERLALLAGAFPALRGFSGPLPPSTQAERFRFHYAVQDLLEALAAERPLVVALDDLHWADEASLELIGHLLRRQVEAPLLLTLSYRPRSAPPLLSSAIAAVAREQALAQIGLGPLTRTEADELLGEQVPPRLRPALYDDSGGNPFLLIELARAAAAAPAAGGNSNSRRRPTTIPCRLVSRASSCRRWLRCPLPAWLR